MKHNDLELIRGLPDALALEAYKWFLCLTNKGQVTQVAKREGGDPYSEWKSISNTVRKNPFTYKLWKPFATYHFKRCDWCVYYVDFKCRNRSCYFIRGLGDRNLYKHSIQRASKVFEIPLQDILFIRKSLTSIEQSELDLWIKNNVEVFITASEEKAYYDRIYDKVYAQLDSKGHFSAKVKKAYGIIQYLGEDPEDIKSSMYEKLAEMIRRYDYLPEQDLILNCSRSLSNLIVNITDRANAQKRKVNLRVGESQKTYVDAVKHLENKPSKELDPEEVLIKKDDREAILRVVNNLDGELGKSVGVLMGKEDPEFTEFLKGRNEIKQKKSWAKYYDGVDPVRLGELRNTFVGYNVSSEILKLVEKSNKIEGENAMAKSAQKANNIQPIGGNQMIKVTFPKKKCIMCAYWIPYLSKKGKKSRIPKDCSPAYPGCPTHVYEMDWQFPVKSAAIQLRQFQMEGDNAAIKEFIDKTPTKYVGEIFELARTIDDEDLEAIIVEEEEDILASMDHAEMMAYVGQKNLGDEIEGWFQMTEDELREALQELRNSISDEDDDEDMDDDEDTEDEDTAIHAKLQPIDVDED
jgi:hypothetical protein